jgi:serine/threonine-protein kinase HipA
MPDLALLAVELYGETVGTLTHIQGDRNLFAFTQAYADQARRPTLSLSFKNSLGALITEHRPTQTRVLPFLSNMLPEETMRTYLAQRAGVSVQREFFLLWALGKDLPGAVTIRPADGSPWPQDAASGADGRPTGAQEPLRFSLAGVQLKFSGVMAATGGLTIPAEGSGGSWIIKLPSQRFEGVPENEFAMLSLAKRVGIEVPDINLVPLAEIQGLPAGLGVLKGPALSVRRFDRAPDGPVHIEDFAQVFAVYPEAKYKRASARNIAEVIANESTLSDIAEFIRRLTFNTLIGNADMHLKNWSLIYRDRYSARLAPAYDYVSTIAYIPDGAAALTYGRTKRMDEYSRAELSWIAAKARLPEELVLDTATETVERFHAAWAEEKNHLPLTTATIDAIERHVRTVPLA